MEQDTQLHRGLAQAPLMASSRCLAAASPVLMDMLEVLEGQGQFYTLDVSADDRDGWEQVLCIISPDQCFPKVTLVRYASQFAA